MTTVPPPLPRDLGDGLMLRQATVADAEALADFNARIHSPTESPNEGVRAWTHALLTRPHPTVTPADFTLVEEVASGRIVSSLALISQRWAYEGIPFGVGRPELVGTDPDFRTRGLVRAQFEVIHGWSAARGEEVQAITGIPWYYRLFGYEYALNLGGGRLGYAALVPRLAEGATEPFRVRPATAADIPIIERCTARGARRSPVVALRDRARWQHELTGFADGSIDKMELAIVERPDGTPVGMVAHSSTIWGQHLALIAYELLPEVSWAAVTPSIIRALDARGQTIAARDGTPCVGASFWLGEAHPAYEVAAAQLPGVRPPYAFYLRVADLPGFVRHVAPALEARLAASPLAGQTGTTHISFYRSGLALTFQAGRLVTIAPWQPLGAPKADAAFPDRTFLQLLFGYRALAELRYAFADCWVRNDEQTALLDALFPRRPSAVWAHS